MLRKSPIPFGLFDSFLVSILIVCLYVFFIYQISFSQSSPYLNIWFILTELTIGSCLLLTAIHFKTGQYQLQHADRWLKLVCFLIGTAIAVGVTLLYYFLPHQNPELNIHEAIILAALLIIVSQTFALTFFNTTLELFLLGIHSSHYALYCRAVFNSL